MVLNTVKDKIAIVTGGGSGIGLAFVRLLYEKGCNVVIADVTLTPEAELLVQKASSASCPKVLYKKTDVIKWQALQDLFDFTESFLGAPDLVCPGAGLFEPQFSNFWNDSEPPERDGYSTIDVNINHPTKVTRLAIRNFLKHNKPGIICHISSIGGQVTRLSVPIYCATKAYVNHFIRAFALLEDKERIKVVGIAPGAVSTPLWYKYNPEKLKAVGPTDSWLQPEDVANAMYDLCLNPVYKGGTVLEISSKGVTRPVGVFNDTGPPGIGHSIGANMDLEQDVFDLLKKERDSKL